MTRIVAVAQLALQVGDVAGNRRKAREAAAQAARQGASLLILPELADSGYVFASAEEARQLAEPAGRNATLREWRELAAELGLAIAGGFCELGGDGLLYNSAAIVDQQGTRAVYRKAHLWDAEKQIFTPGDARPPVVDLGFGRIGLVICYDLEFPEWVRLPALAGADLIAAPVNWPAADQAAQPPAEVVKAQAAAAVNGVFVAVADRCAAERGVRWISGSMIVAPDGQAVAGPVLADEPALLTAACDLTAARDKRVSENNDLFADRRPRLYGLAPATDERVAAAKAHWAPRFIANGTDYADCETTMRRITRWAYWCEGWGETARRYELIASESERAAKTQTATDAWRRAALCWHWAKFVFTDDPVQQRAAHDRAVACFRRAAPGLAPPAEPLAIPYRGTSLAAYLRVPVMADKPPVVIMIPGLDSVKEELQATAEYLLARGLAVLAIDGPGQGEAEYELSIEPAYERVTTAVVDYLVGARADVDAARVGVLGVSLGGYYAARSAAREPRLKAVVALAGPYRFDLDWDALPPQTRQTFQVRSGAKTADEARALAGRLTLEDCAAGITVPLLVAHGGRDRLIPAYHAERLATEAPGAELLLYPDGNHGLTNLAFESRARMADWLAARL